MFFYEKEIGICLYQLFVYFQGTAALTSSFGAVSLSNGTVVAPPATTAPTSTATTSIDVSMIATTTAKTTNSV